MGGFGASTFGEGAFSGSLAEAISNLIELEDGLAFAGGVDVGGYIPMTEAVVAGDVATSRALFRNDISDGVWLQDLSIVVHTFITVDGFSAIDSAELRARKLIAVVDALLAADVVTNRLSAVYVLAASFAAEDVAARAVREEITDAVALADLMTESMRAYHALFSGIVLADSVTANARFLIPLSEGVTLSDDVSSSAILLQAIEDGVGFAAALDIEDGHYYAWVLDAESRASWHYDNFGFNSFAAFNDQYLGAMYDGVYVLDGDDDQGAPINATLRTGILTFGTSAIKRPSVMYICAKRSGDLVAKVIITNEDGGTEAHWYALEGGASVAMREDRIEPDGGLESVTLQFELVNVDGADFDIDQMRVLAVALNRRY